MFMKLRALRPSFRLTLLRDERGQAMVEYSTITFFMLIGAGGTGLVYFLPHFLNALNTYLGSIYYMLSLAIP